MNPLETFASQFADAPPTAPPNGHRPGMLGFATLLQDAGLFVSTAAAAIGNPLAPKQPQFPARAKRNHPHLPEGGPSHVDTFDQKPR